MATVEKEQERARALIGYQWTSAALGIAITTVMLYLIRRDQLHSKHAVWWFFVALLVAIFGIFPRLSDAVASFLGVSYPPILLVVVGVGLILVKMLTMDLAQSSLEAKLHRLSQQLALLENERDRESKRESS
jgi:hypothetical protein